jgi:hypothetical protein
VTASGSSANTGGDETGASDHPPLLQDALLTTQKRLLIISRWIRAKVVSFEFLKKLEALLQRSVSVFMGYGTSAEKDNTENLYDTDRLALEKLRQLDRSGLSGGLRFRPD